MESVNIEDYYNAKQDECTRDFIMQQTMLRIKEPKRSLDFYINKLGFKLIWHKHFVDWKFSIYFVALTQLDVSTQCSEEEKWKRCMTTPGCIELTHNHGTENEQEPQIYNTGNSDNKGAQDKVRGGFGHIGITVPDVYKACQRFKELGIEFQKSPNQGGMKGLAFIRDPDGYSVEVLPQGEMVVQEIDCLGVSSVDQQQKYQDNSKK